MMSWNSSNPPSFTSISFTSSSSIPHSFIHSFKAYTQPLLRSLLHRSSSHSFMQSFVRPFFPWFLFVQITAAPQPSSSFVLTRREQYYKWSNQLIRFPFNPLISWDTLFPPTQWMLLVKSYLVMMAVSLAAGVKWSECKREGCAGGCMGWEHTRNKVLEKTISEINQNVIQKHHHRHPHNHFIKHKGYNFNTKLVSRTKGRTFGCPFSPFGGICCVFFRMRMDWLLKNVVTVADVGVEWGRATKQNTQSENKSLIEIYKKMWFVTIRYVSITISKYRDVLNR